MSSSHVGLYGREYDYEVKDPEFWISLWQDFAPNS